ncbi:hypothetical protein GCM10023195_43820 [Actinoallomurus liliacearum]|uniref:Uncharacterized protein n=1 Tax=Actinoallomurus liliacearum TaxID=1080073 RepID=A0ABP8TMM8_9ACTN
MLQPPRKGRVKVCLFIVEALSTAWGHHPGTDGGKVVWARFTTPART